MPRSMRPTWKRFARSWWAGSAAGTATSPALEFPVAEPGKLVAEFASLGERSVFLIGEFPSLTQTTPFLTAEFDFLT